MGRVRFDRADREKRKGKEVGKDGSAVESQEKVCRWIPGRSKRMRQFKACSAGESEFSTSIEGLLMVNPASVSPTPDCWSPTCATRWASGHVVARLLSNALDRRPGLSASPFAHRSYRDRCPQPTWRTTTMKQFAK